MGKRMVGEEGVWELQTLPAATDGTSHACKATDGSKMVERGGQGLTEGGHRIGVGSRPRDWDPRLPGPSPEGARRPMVLRAGRRHCPSGTWERVDAIVRLGHGSG
eukprot:240221-Chlamydomonas_euryale.AAC.1